MASQIGKTRVYSSIDEKNAPSLVTCPNCKVQVVPRGISSSRKHDIGDMEKHCPNCGHVFGRKNH